MGEVYQSILEEHFIETLDASKIWIFQDDNARPHQTAAVERIISSLVSTKTINPITI